MYVVLSKAEKYVP